MQTPDGVAVIGETLWIRGRAFGRQPAVTVGGRPAAVLARTRDGGIVVRVPPATPSGSQPVVVSNEVGRGERPIAVRRYAAVLAPGAGEIGWAELGADGPIAAGATAVRGARWLALSSDGRAAYLAEASRSIVHVVEMPAPGGPKVVYRLDLGNEPIVALAAAGRAPVLAVVREKRRDAARHVVAAASGAQHAAGAAARDRATRTSSPPTFRPTASCSRSPPPTATASRCWIWCRAAARPWRAQLAILPGRPRERAGRRRVLAGGRHAVGAVGRHAAQPRERAAADRAARAAARRQPGEPERSSRSRAP